MWPTSLPTCSWRELAFLRGIDIAEEPNFPFDCESWKRPLPGVCRTIGSPTWQEADEAREINYGERVSDLIHLSLVGLRSELADLSPFFLRCYSLRVPLSFRYSKQEAL